MSDGMSFVYSELMKHQTSINDLQRLYPTIEKLLDDVRGVCVFRDVYRGDIVEAIAKSQAAFSDICELRNDSSGVRKDLNKFIETFNQWADLIRELKKSVDELKKENEVLRAKIGLNTPSVPVSPATAPVSSSAKSVSSTTATVGASSVTSTTAVKAPLKPILKK